MQSVANNGMRRLKEGKLIAICNENGYVTCSVVPKVAQQIIIYGANIKYIIGTNNHTRYYTMATKEKQFSPEGNHAIWDAIPCFHLYVCGDPYFHFTTLGRHGHDTCKCTYFTLTTTQWKMEDTPLGDIMTLDRIRGAVIPQFYGVKILPQWNVVEPSQYMSPILHMEMDLVNLARNTMIDYIDTNVDNISEHKQQEREKMIQLQEQLKLAPKEELTIDTRKRDANDERSKLIALIENATKNRDETREVITAWKAQKDKDAAYVTTLMKERKDANAKVSTVKKQVTE